MNILFITSTRIGDAVLSTGLLRYINDTYPDARVTVACGPLAATLFEGYPNLNRIIALKKQKRHGHWLKLWRGVIATRWDMVIDLRNSAVSRLILTKQRYVFCKRSISALNENAPLHKVQQNAAVMKVSINAPPAPKLWFTQPQLNAAKNLIGDHNAPIIAIGPTANWHAKTWPVDRFKTLAHWLLSHDSPINNAKIAIIAAPNEQDDAYKLYNALPADRRINIIGKTDPATAAATLALCDFYIGNDSGLMHCAAAVGTPTLGLFGPSYPALYAPWGDHCAYVRTPKTLEDLIDFDGYTPQTTPCLMDGITVDMVKNAVIEHLNTQ